jgi:cytochrome c biogenesis protein CcmG, thiol:disulfide interchange protein DsbE
VSSRARAAAQCGAVAFVSFLLVLLVWRVTHANGGVVAELAKGRSPPAPEVSLESLGEGGPKITLRTHAGRVVVLNFWASWCGPCEQEAPGFEAAWRRWRSHLVSFVGVDVRDSAGDARRFVERHRLSYPLARGGEATLTLYGVGALPQTFIITPRGRVLEHLSGFLSEETLNARIARALRLAGAD